MSAIKKTPRISVPGAAAKSGPTTVEDEAAPKPTRADKIAELALGPTVSNVITATTYLRSKSGAIEDGPAFVAMQSSIKKVQDGDMREAEAFLMAQVISLNLIFNVLARRSSAQTQMPHLDTFLRLALKAQNQCRMTLETLATIKNPPVLFARQANINNGGQLQVNNDAAPSQTTRAAKTETSKTELLEASDDKRLDTGTQGAAGGADPHMETVGAGHRAAHG